MSSANDGSRVLVALRVPATAERAFAAFTGEIGQWWQPNGLFRFTRRGGTLRFEPGPSGRLVETSPAGDEFVIGEVREWDPPRRLVTSWRHESFAADHETELHVRFDEVAEKQTRVTVEHFGWDRIPPEHTARHGFPLDAFQRRFAEWWQSLLARLASTVSR